MVRKTLDVQTKNLGDTWHTFMQMEGDQKKESNIIKVCAGEDIEVRFMRTPPLLD